MITGEAVTMKRALGVSLILALSGIVFSLQLRAADMVPGSWLRDIKVPYSGENGEGAVTVRIYFPKTYTKGENYRTIIALHGYNLPAKEWETESPVARLANDYNMVIVCPDMGKTLYEFSFYPESTEKWGGMPGGRFIADVLIPFLRNNYGLARDRKRTGIMGISTGGRGALLVAASRSDLVGAAAGLSGDYDPASMPRDRILTLIYGPYKDFRDRWENDDNIMKLATHLKDTPVYLWHGESDSVVPFEQSMLLAVQLKKLQKASGGGYDVTFNKAKHAVHTWRYWGRALPEVMAFFNSKLESSSR